MPNPYIIFFDAQCSLCNHFINFVFKRDTKRQFLYAPLQGATAKQYLKKEDIKTLKSVIVLKNNVTLKEAQAIQTVMKQLYPSYSVLFSILPSKFFNVFYRFIAKKRYKVFGKKEDLHQPSKNQRKYFLP